MRIAGAVGQVRVGYQVAASLGAWVVELPSRVPRVFQCRAKVTDTNKYWLSRADEGFDLALALGPTELLWRGVAVTIDGDQATAILSERPIVTEWAQVERTGT